MFVIVYWRRCFVEGKQTNYIMNVIIFNDFIFELSVSINSNKESKRFVDNKFFRPI